jgi:hypothetical protein
LPTQAIRDNINPNLLKEARMKLIVGYDRDFTAQFFRRSLNELIQPEANKKRTSIVPEEIDYMSERLAETSMFSYVEKLGTPWVFDDLKELSQLHPSEATRAQLEKSECAANQLLIVEGLVLRSGALRPTTQEEWESANSRMGMARKLYRNASVNKCHGAVTRVALCSMADHLGPWVQYLSLLPGNDYMQLYFSRETF